MDNLNGPRKTSLLMLLAPTLSVLLVLSSPAQTAGEGAGKKLSCFVSILPQAFFVERVGGSHVDVRVMVGPGQSPHTFEPTARFLSELSRSNVYFTIGVAFEEALVARVERSFPSVRIVDTAAGIERRSMVGDPEHADGLATAPGESASAHEGAPPHGVLDPHVWLSPRLAVTIARNIRDALAELDPDHSAAYTENHRELQAELEQLDQELAGMLGPHRGRSVFVFHPAYGYFTDAYGLRQVEIEKGGNAPGPRYLAEVLERAQAEGVGAIFVQPQVSKTQADMVAKAIGVDVIELDPLAREYVDNLRRIGRRIADSLERTRR